MPDIDPGPVAGVDCITYYNSAATHVTPTWVAIPKMRDVQVADFGVNPVEANSRESNWEAFVCGLIKLGVTFNYLHSRGADTVRDALAAMVTGRTHVEFAVMDGTITHVGARGVRSYFLMEKFSYSQDLEGSQVWEGSLKPAYEVQSAAKVDPDLYVVPGT